MVVSAHYDIIDFNYIGIVFAKINIIKQLDKNQALVGLKLLYLNASDRRDKTTQYKFM